MRLFSPVFSIEICGSDEDFLQGPKRPFEDRCVAAPELPELKAVIFTFSDNQRFLFFVIKWLFQSSRRQQTSMNSKPSSYVRYTIIILDIDLHLTHLVVPLFIDISLSVSPCLTTARCQRIRLASQPLLAVDE